MLQPNNPAPDRVALAAKVEHSLVSRLRDTFGNDGLDHTTISFRTEELPVDVAKLVARNIARQGWRVEARVEAVATNGPDSTKKKITLTFSGPPEGSLPLTPIQTKQAEDMIRGINRFLTQGVGDGLGKYRIVGAVPFRVIDFIVRRYRSDKFGVIMLLNKAGRPTELQFDRTPGQ